MSSQPQTKHDPGDHTTNSAASGDDVSENYRDLVSRYATYAPIYDRRFAVYSRRTLSKAVEAIPEDAKRIIDVACGTGLFGEMLRHRRPDLELLGVDISPDMVEVARHRFDGHESYQWDVGRAESLPADDASFDVLTCNNAFHLVERPMDGLAEFHRVLRPGGWLILVDWCREYPTMLALHGWLRLVGRHRRDVRTRAELTELVGQAGFEIDAVERFKAGWFWGLMRITAVSPGSGQRTEE